MLEPMCTKSRTESEDPSFAKDRRLSELPSWRQSSTDSALPQRKKPRKLIVDLALRKSVPQQLNGIFQSNFCLSALERCN